MENIVCDNKNKHDDLEGKIKDMKKIINDQQKLLHKQFKMIEEQKVKLESQLKICRQPSHQPLGESDHLIQVVGAMYGRIQDAICPSTTSTNLIGPCIAQSSLSVVSSR